MNKIKTNVVQNHRALRCGKFVENIVNNGDINFQVHYYRMVN